MNPTMTKTFNSNDSIMTFGESNNVSNDSWLKTIQTIQATFFYRPVSHSTKCKRPFKLMKSNIWTSVILVWSVTTCFGKKSIKLKTGRPQRFVDFRTIRRNISMIISGLEWDKWVYSLQAQEILVAQEVVRLDSSPKSREFES